MANMPHCRFRNTLDDLEDCYGAMTDILYCNESDVSDEELLAAARLIAKCKAVCDLTDGSVVGEVREFSVQELRSILRQACGKPDDGNPSLA